MLLLLALPFGSGEASGAQLTASWIDNTNGVAATKLERRLATGTAFAAIADTPPGVTSYVDTSVSPGTAYCYRARAYTSNGMSPYSAEACGTASDDGLRVIVRKAGDGAGTVVSSPAGIDCGATCSKTYPAGTSATLTGKPASGSVFVGWSGSGCTGTAPCTVAGNVAITVTATFGKAPYALTVIKSGPGTITSSPAGISCGSVCSKSYTAGALVTLTPTPVSGYVFAGWTGACTGTGSCAVTMKGTAAVGAVFRPTLAGGCALPAGQVRVPYSASCPISGGSPPYSCSVASGSLPAGLTLGRDCRVTGTPAIAERRTFTVRVRDVIGLMRDMSGSLTVNGP